MSFELPDILKLRNLIAAAVAVAIEWLMASQTGVPFSAASFAAILVVCLVLAWVLEKLGRRLFGRRGATPPRAADD